MFLGPRSQQDSGSEPNKFGLVLAILRTDTEGQSSSAPTEKWLREEAMSWLMVWHFGTLWGWGMESTEDLQKTSSESAGRANLLLKVQT